MGRFLLALLRVGVCACSSRGMAFGHSSGGASRSMVPECRKFKELVVGTLIRQVGDCKSAAAAPLSFER